ncbi:hypothetical protein MPTK1_5g03410 [Marchantia polymorpha subsp. ruderalis]|uniref:Secreted protein n=2 Tax=Marchantia polymorpha TaxID=3197 RepID=A0AAF6BEI4_MARPO|nr:hypothetical protein MARPO_0133s0046 [Marchantia polymorpha]BBN10418.1 hypothetical protein Mp_5g03410 [Marchantia polymorpha subsp. ruderalis]|eukprot:PTQ29905.1 hypothetical protein MARPO_0133s0046 [Marchantia polymorpha]
MSWRFLLPLTLLLIRLLAPLFRALRKFTVRTVTTIAARQRVQDRVFPATSELVQFDSTMSLSFLFLDSASSERFNKVVAKCDWRAPSTPYWPQHCFSRCCSCSCSGLVSYLNPPPRVYV